MPGVSPVAMSAGRLLQNGNLGLNAFDNGTLLNSSAYLHPNESGVTAHYDSFSFFIFQREPVSCECHIPLFP